MSAAATVLSPRPATSFSLPTSSHHAGLALAPPRESVLRDGLQQQQPTISLLLERRDEVSGERFTSLAVAPNETIQSVKLRVSRRSAFTSRHCLVLGDRELLEDDVTVGELAVASAKQPATGSNMHLHIVCKLKDIESVSIATSMQRTLTFKNEDVSPQPIRRSKSALTALLSTSDRLDSDSPMAASQLAMRRSPSLPPDGVVHLIIRNSSAGVHWRHAPGAKLELSISADATAEDVAAELEAANDLPANQHLLMYNGKVLAADQSLASYGIGAEHGSAMLELIPAPFGSSGSGSGVQRAAAGGKPSSPPLSSPEHGLFANWQAAREGLASGQLPQLAPSGSGGSYFLRSAAGQKVALFKPADEEPFGANNPRHMGCSPDGHGLRKGIRPGEGAIREVAAYVLDHGHFAGVPPTAMVTCQPNMLPGSLGSSVHGAKVGSLQQFVPATTDCEEQGPSAFPVHEVHKIAQLDMRLANADRNGGNILATKSKGSWTLTPIDHGYTLPSSLQDICFEWLNWPQAHVPFDAETTAYIAALDAEADLATLAEHGLVLRSECKRVFRATTMCLKLGAAAGLTPYVIGSIMCRELRMKSPLEKLHSRALQLTRGQSALAVSSSGISSFIDGFHGGSGITALAPNGKSQDEVYLDALQSLLQEYIDQLRGDSLLDGVLAA
jgi:hypothetical protein